VRTFARLPLVTEPESVDAVVLGAPFDTATSFRPGARFGPEGVRAASALLRPWHPTLSVDVFAHASTADGGDLEVVPGNAEATAARLAEGLDAWLATGAVPIVVGGDHSILLGELRAHAARHGPLALLLIDAHADVWDQYYGERLFHGTVVRRAVEEGLVDPGRSLLAGMRGPLYAEADLEAARELGFELVTGDELRAVGPGDLSLRALSRVAEGPCFLSFDIDVIDPAFAPATGTPEVAGLLPHEALTLLRSLAGLRFVGFDVVEVAPPYDGPAQTTALLAANIVWELLALRVVAGE
jgi:agmatinase